MDNKNIVLTGMPGAGKSTIGVLLAKSLKKPFIDTDLIIQQTEGEFLQDIIDKKGIEAFLLIEEKSVLSHEFKNHVIATGGSVIYSEKAVKHLKSNGTFIYLQLEYQVLNKRINNIKSRGIAMNPGLSLKDIYSERTPLYEKYADIIINCQDKNMEDIVSEIKKKLI
jgi:shikimate kinase